MFVEQASARAVSTIAPHLLGDAKVSQSTVTYA